MSADGDTAAPHEVVIVRRRGGEGEDGHHGGAWKIAFADLMTAMMAFFLVMWLLNVSDKEKIQQIATYFNPLQLNSKQPTVKGIEKEQEQPKASEKSEGPVDASQPNNLETEIKRKGYSKPGGDGEKDEGAEKTAEQELFNDPYGVLSRIASEAQTQQQEGSAPMSDRPLPGGDSFKDPFESFADQRRANGSAIGSDGKSDAGGQAMQQGLESPLQMSPLQVKPDPSVNGPPKATNAKPADGAKAEVAAKAEDGDKPAQNATAQDDKEVRDLEADLSKALGAIAPQKKPNIEVKRVSEGVLISLTDDFKFGMFALSSAEPLPDTVLVMEKVAKVLAPYEGKIVVRGHTDARPFRSERNNNWRLSMSRAQMAYYMLARGGVDEKRFESIEGRADRDLKKPEDPQADENRRIEIMLRPKS
jgi:chemotaxis protein MotB